MRVDRDLSRINQPPAAGSRSIFLNGALPGGWMDLDEGMAEMLLPDPIQKDTVILIMIWAVDQQFRPIPVPRIHI